MPTRKQLYRGGIIQNVTSFGDKGQGSKVKDAPGGGVKRGVNGDASNVSQNKVVGKTCESHLYCRAANLREER